MVIAFWANDSRFFLKASYELNAKIFVTENLSIIFKCFHGTKITKLGLIADNKINYLGERH